MRTRLRYDARDARGPVAWSPLKDLEDKHQP